MALDTAFFSLFPDIYHVEGEHLPVGHEELLHHDNAELTPEEKSAKAEKVEKAKKTVPKDFDCLRFLMETFENKCMPFSEYGLGHVKYIVEFCETSSTSQIVEKAMDMGEICNNLIV